MARRVALARRNLFQDRRRAALSIVGVAAALLLVLVLDGIFAGAMQQVTAYVRNSPADVFVAQQGARTMHMTQTALAPETVDSVAAVDGVAWAEGLRYTTSILDAGDGQRTSYVFGYDVDDGRGGPARFSAGSSPGDGEIVVDDVAAAELGIELGDTVSVLGAELRVSGLSTEGTNIVNTTVYVRSEDFAELRGDSIAYVLVGAAPGVDPTVLMRRIESAVPGTTAQTRAEFVRQEQSLVRDMSADVMRIMTVIAFLIALVVVGLTLFTTTLAKLHEYGVIKALGAGPTRLDAVVAVQSTWVVVLGLVVATATAWGTGVVLEAATPNIQVSIQAESVLRTGLSALVAGTLATVAPLGRVHRVDPATSFRRPQ
jgi:putative ABC transport system permease protein